jgi:serine/threonine protein phosphatase PrpC
LYRVRNQKIEQLTRDHTVIGERMRMGLITAERAESSVSLLLEPQH